MAHRAHKAKYKYYYNEQKSSENLQGIVLLSKVSIFINNNS